MKIRSLGEDLPSSQPLRHRITHIRDGLERHRLAARDVPAFHLLDDELDGFVRDGVDVLMDIQLEGKLRIVERDERHVLRRPGPFRSGWRTRCGRARCRRRTLPSHAGWLEAETAFVRIGVAALPSRRTSGEEFIKRYRKITNSITAMLYICGCCYTQITDVQQETTDPRHQSVLIPPYSINNNPIFSGRVVFLSAKWPERATKGKIVAWWGAARTAYNEKVTAGRKTDEEETEWSKGGPRRKRTRGGTAGTGLSAAISSRAAASTTSKSGRNSNLTT